MPTRMVIDVWSDYVCPFCYLQLPPLREAAREGNLEVRWRAYELRPEPAALPDPKGEYLRRVWEGSVYPMAERMGLRLKLPPVQPRSRKALEAAEFARHKGRFEPMHLALFRAFFEQGRNIGELSALLDLAGSVGLNPSDFLGSQQAREYAPKVLADQKLAARLGITAVPALLFHYATQPLEAGLVKSGVHSVQEIETIVAELRRTPPPPVAAPPAQHKFGHRGHWR